MYKCKTVILFTSLVLASNAEAQQGAGNGQQVNPESKAPATLVPTMPQVVPPADASSPLCNDCEPPARTGPWQQLWFKAGYSSWRISDAPLPYPLLTTGTGPIPGVIGDPNTTILYGNSHVDFGSFQGLNLEGGLWLDDQHLNGLGFSLQTFNERSSGATFSSTGSDGVSLSRPFFDVTQNLMFQNNVLQVSTVDGRSGSFSVSNTAKFGGFDVYYLRNFWNNCGFTLSGLAGYRFFQLTEHLNMTQVSTTTPGAAAQPLLLDNIIVDSLTLQDSFSTRNRINGVEIGLKGEWNWGAFFAGGTGKVTLGPNSQTVDINGSTTGTIDGTVTTLPGGLNALTSNRAGFVSNMGSNKYSQFIIMPEFGVYVGVQVSPHMRVQLGYDCLYINNVTRPGLQIDPSVNQSFVPSSQFYGDSSGPVAPLITQSKHDFFASGVNLSLEFQY